MLRRFAVLAIAILAVAVLVARADDFWTKKPWKEWSKGDIDKLTHDSPWARKWKLEAYNSAGHLPSVTGSVGSTAAAGGAQAGGGTSATDTMGGQANAITYFVQLRSSTPLREAVVRQNQIQKKYDKMSDADKQKFDAEMDKIMRGSEDTIEIHVTFETGNTAFSNALSKYWSSVPEGVIPEGIYLVVDSGTPVGPLTYAPPSAKGATTEFDLTFPRMMNNQPVVGPNAKVIKFEFPHPKLGDYPEQTAKVEFALDKMMFEGKPSF